MTTPLLNPLSPLLLYQQVCVHPSDAAQTSAFPLVPTFVSLVYLQVFKNCNWYFKKQKQR